MPLDNKVYFFSTPLYSQLKISSGVEAYQLLNTRVKVDAYNPKLKENTTYEIWSHKSPTGALSAYPKTMHGIWAHTLECVRTGEQSYVFSYFDAENMTLQKIGQYPSIADFHISQIRQYDKVLPKEKLKEFTRAIGLTANGVGIGSFVYLRRIFEHLISEAYELGKIEPSWDEDQYQRSKISERIGQLASHLPAFLAENKSLYAILSKGIHELSEDECLAYFDTVKVGIELILDEKMEQYEKRRKIAEAQKKLSELNSTLKK